MDVLQAALEGLKVLDFTEYAAGPFCTMMLADLGADVIKVEPPDGDRFRQWGPCHRDVSAPFLQLNRNKKSVTLNLKTAYGQEIAQKLASTADVLVENFRPGVMKQFKLSYSELRHLNPQLIYCSLSGYGQTGPYWERGGFDLVLQGHGGLMSVTGEPGGSPVKAGVPLVDLGASTHAVVGILAAYVARQRTGRGQLVDISLLDVPVSWLVLLAGKYWATGEVQRPLGSAHPLSSPYQAFATKDGYITIAAGNQTLWLATLRVLGMEHLAEDARFRTNNDRARNQKQLVPLLEKVLATDTSEKWIERLIAEGVPAGPVNSVDKVLEDPQVLHRDMVVLVDHPRLGPIKLIGSPIKLSDTPVSIRKLPPELGAHTEEVLRDLGYELSEIERLRRDGII